MGDADIAEVDTPQGRARAHLHLPGGAPRAGLVLGHGAGGGVAAPDLVAATGLALGLGLAVALVEQPYRVAGRRGAPRARSTRHGPPSWRTWRAAHSPGCRS